MLFVCCALLLGGCGPEPVRIAVITKLESSSILGMSTWDNVKMYLEDGTMPGVEFIPFDDSGDPEMIPQVYKQIRAQGIQIIITAQTSTTALRLKQEIDRDTLPVCVFISGSTTEKLSGLDDYIFRVIPDLAQEQKSIAQYIAARKHANLLVLVDTKNHAYSQAAFLHFQKFYPSAVHSIHLNIMSFDIESLKKELATLSFDGVYLLVGDYQTNAGAVAQLAMHFAPQAPIYYTPWMKTQAILNTAGASIHQSVMPSLFPAKGQNPVIDQHVADFHKKFGYYPNTVSLNVVRILDLLQEVLHQTKPDPESIKAYILHKKAFSTRFGPLLLNEYGDNTDDLFFLTDIEREFE